MYKEKLAINWKKEREGILNESESSIIMYESL